VAFLFDTDAISESLRPRPSAVYQRWLADIPREYQFASAVSIGELYAGAFHSSGAARHLRNIEERVLPRLTVLPYDVAVSRSYGLLRARLMTIGRPLSDADLQIAATALAYDLDLVTGNVRHFGRVEGLRLETVLADARSAGR
jgi:predicted nucleic acid-binding protein